MLITINNLIHSRGKLWNYLETYYKVAKEQKKGHTRSSSCDANIASERPDVLDIPENPECKKSSSTKSLAPGSDEKYTSICQKYSSTSRNFVPTSDDASTELLLQNAQQLLQSINATLNRSNSLISHMDEFTENFFPPESTTTTLKLFETTSDSMQDVNVITPETSTNGCAEEFLEETSLVHGLVGRWDIPESRVREWAAEIICALEALHQQDVIVTDLGPENILLDDDEHIAMTYVARCSQFDLSKKESCHVAPEIKNFTPPMTLSVTADVWSFGILLYELLTGYVSLSLDVFRCVLLNQYCDFRIFSKYIPEIFTLIPSSTFQRDCRRTQNLCCAV